MMAWGQSEGHGSIVQESVMKDVSILIQ